jgi:hypothetical protein
VRRAQPGDGGDWPPAIKAGTGTGSTPTLMGFGPGQDRLALITDGVNRMKLVAFWRDGIPADFKAVPNTSSRRVAGVLPIYGRPAAGRALGAVRAVCRGQRAGRKTAARSASCPTPCMCRACKWRNLCACSGRSGWRCPRNGGLALTSRFSADRRAMT